MLKVDIIFSPFPRTMFKGNFCDLVMCVNTCVNKYDKKLSKYSEKFLLTFLVYTFGDKSNHADSCFWNHHFLLILSAHIYQTQHRVCTFCNQMTIGFFLPSLSHFVRNYQFSECSQMTQMNASIGEGWISIFMYFMGYQWIL